METARTGPDDQNTEVLQTHVFTAGEGEEDVSAEQTPYGKFVAGLQWSINQFREEAADEFEDMDLNDPNNISGAYLLAYEKALDGVRRGDYKDGMACILCAVNSEEDAGMVYDDVLTPTEAEEIYFEMGRNKFPELRTANFDDICTLWEEVGISPVPEELIPPQSHNTKISLPILRSELYSMMNRTANLVTGSTGKVGIKLCYAMMSLERRLSESVGKISSPEMTMRERFAIDCAKKTLG